MKKIISCVFASLAIGLTTWSAAGVDALKEGFACPPDRAKSDVWWHWINGNVSKEGITADLESMKAAGIGGAHIFDVGYFKPGPITFNTPAWDDCILHAHREAQRLGLRLTLANCSGFSSSGGPWVKPEDSMKYVVWTETVAHGGETFSGALPQPPNPNGFYRDIAVVAAKDPVGLRRGRVEGHGRVQMDEKPSQTVWTFDFDAPWRAHEVTYRVEGQVGWFAMVDIRIEASDDGATWRTLRAFREKLCYNGESSTLPREAEFGEATARHYRVAFAYDRGYSPCHLLDVDVGSFARLGRLSERTFRIGRGKNGIPPVHLPREDVIDERDVVMLTDRVGPDGRLTWQPPSAGRWTIYRIGEAANGFKCVPPSDAGLGYEIDKFSRRVLQRHFDAYVGRLARLAGIDPTSDPWQRTGIVAVLVDSYEAGGQNWGEGFAEAFRARTGYSILGKYLPTLCGRVVGSVEKTEKFLADYRETIAELFAASYADAMAEACEKAGLLLTLEPYGHQPCSNDRYARKAHIPMSEFWVAQHSNPTNFEAYVPKHVIEVVREAHAYHRRIVGAEAFTTSARSHKSWAQTPFDYKAEGDVVHAIGINRMVYHRFAHQPWTNPTRYPGMTMGPWGTHFERTETWWPLVGDWLKYQARTQFLLQEGAFVNSTFETNRVDDFRCACSDVRQQHRRYEDGTEGWFVACSRREATRVTCSFAIAGRTPEVWNAENGDIRKTRVWREIDGRTEVTLDFPPCGACFVMFRTTDGHGAADAEPLRHAYDTREVTSDWRVTFPLDWHTPHPHTARRTFTRLTDWSLNEDAEVRHFSGTATYETTLALPRTTPDACVVLDLGAVHDMAEVEVDGVKFPVLWRPPFRVDVTDAVKGKTSAKLVVRVTNTWVNRLIGDAQKPEDAPGCFDGPKLVNWPEFILKGTESPTGRGTFTTYRHWSKNDKLLPAGLLGPVRLVAESQGSGARVFAADQLQQFRASLGER